MNKFGTLADGEMVERSLDGVVAWYRDKDGTLFRLWTDEGTTSIPVSAVANDKYFQFHDLVEEVNSLEADGKYVCTRCEQIYDRPWSLRHFAGVYCSDCAIEYKREKSRRCMICGAPRWRCTC